MGKKIFVSYRRSDASADARSVYQRLRSAFGARKLFMDVDTIAKGGDFTVALNDALADTAVMLVLIGKTWLDVRDKDGRRRLDDPTDYVRLEIKTALELGLPVIPVLIEGAALPFQHQLPESLSNLANRQSARLMHDNFSQDVEGLIDAISRYVTRSRRPQLIGLGAIAAAMLAGAAIYQLTLPPQTTVILDKAAYVELLKARSAKLAASDGAPDEVARRRKLVEAKVDDPDSAYKEFVTKQDTLLRQIENAASVLASQVVSEAKAQSNVGNFDQAKTALTELIGKQKAGDATDEQVAEFGEALASAYASVGDLGGAIETYEVVADSVRVPGRLIRSYVQVLLASGQFQRANEVVDKALAGQASQPSFNSADLAWLNDASGQAHENLGLLTVARQKFDVAYEQIRKAASEGLATPQDTAQILNDMTGVSIRQLDLRAARSSLCKAISLQRQASNPLERSSLFARLNMVGLTRQMGLLGTARQQFQDVQAAAESLPADDPFRGFLLMHSALLAIAEHSYQAGLQEVGKAEAFFQRLTGKGQSYLQRTARLEQIKQIAYYSLGDWKQSYERGEVSRDFYRRAFGRLSLDELNTQFWLARASIPAKSPETATILSEAYRTAMQSFEKEAGILKLQGDFLEAERLLASGDRAAGRDMLDKLIAKLFEIENRGDAYIPLADDAIMRVLVLDGKPASAEAVTMYRQQNGQRTVVRAAASSAC